eukprot:GEMP01034996.1.p1 GENE.GEMP01034996.1~~GEMP01034996.1.p1  ORF type:complete len:320 (+),score=53.07 GEMP01034996.1:341-1300(+)
MLEFFIGSRSAPHASTALAEHVWTVSTTYAHGCRRQTHFLAHGGPMDPFVVRAQHKTSKLLGKTKKVPYHAPEIIQPKDLRGGSRGLAPPPPRINRANIQPAKGAGEDYALMTSHVTPSYGSCNAYWWEKIHEAMLNLKWRIKFLADQTAPRSPDDAQNFRAQMLKTLEDIEYCDKCPVAATNPDFPYGFHYFTTKTIGTTEGTTALEKGGNVPMCASTAHMVRFRMGMKKVIYNISKILHGGVAQTMKNIDKEDVYPNVLLPQDAALVKSDLLKLEDALKNLPYAQCCPVFLAAWTLPKTYGKRQQRRHEHSFAHDFI